MKTSDMLGIAGILIGIVTSIYFYWVSRKAKEPNWSIQSNNLIQGYSVKVNELEIYYKKQKIENLTISKVVFWNGGAETINRQDIASANPVRIVAQKNIEILDVIVLSTNNIPCQFSCRLDNDHKTAFIEFDYMDKGNGVILQITHTGISSKDICIKGTIKGTKAITEKSIETVWLPLPTPKSFDRKMIPRTRRWVNGLIYLLLGLAAIGAIIYQFFSLNQQGKAWSTQDYSNLVIALVLFIFTSVRAVNRISGGSPRGLESFEQDQDT